jgi:hypothetical protein
MNKELEKLAYKWQIQMNCSNEEVEQMNRICNEIYTEANSVQEVGVRPEDDIIDAFRYRIYYACQFVRKNYRTTDPLPFTEFNQPEMKELFERMNVDYDYSMATWVATAQAIFLTMIISDLNLIVHRREEYKIRAAHVFNYFLGRNKDTTTAFQAAIYVGNRTAKKDVIRYVKSVGDKNEIIMSNAMQFALHDECLRKNYTPYGAKGKINNLALRALSKQRGQFGGVVLQRLGELVKILHRTHTISSKRLDTDTVSSRYGSWKYGTDQIVTLPESMATDWDDALAISAEVEEEENDSHIESMYNDQGGSTKFSFEDEVVLAETEDQEDTVKGITMLDIDDMACDAMVSDNEDWNQDHRTQVKVPVAGGKIFNTMPARQLDIDREIPIHFVELMQVLQENLEERMAKKGEDLAVESQILSCFQMPLCINYKGKSDNPLFRTGYQMQKDMGLSQEVVFARANKVIDEVLKMSKDFKGNYVIRKAIEIRRCLWANTTQELPEGWTTLGEIYDMLKETGLNDISGE